MLVHWYPSDLVSGDSVHFVDVVGPHSVLHATVVSLPIRTNEVGHFGVRVGGRAWVGYFKIVSCFRHFDYVNFSQACLLVNQLISGAINVTCLNAFCSSSLF